MEKVSKMDRWLGLLSLCKSQQSHCSFLDSFRLTAKLRERYRDFLYPLPLLIHSLPLSQPLSAPPEGAFVTSDDLAQASHHYPESTVYIKLILRVVHCVGLDKGVMTGAHHDSITLSVVLP